MQRVGTVKHIRFDPAYCSSKIATHATLQRTCSLLYGVALPGGGGQNDEVPSTKAFLVAYARLQATRNTVQVLYDEFDLETYHTLRGGRMPRFHPARLPPTSALPAPSVLFDPESPKPCAQRKLSSVVSQLEWCAWVEACREEDAAGPHPFIKYREASRAISTSQSGAGAFLDMFVDKDRATRIPSPEFVVAVQRRFGLYLSCMVAELTLQEAEGIVVDFTGDDLVNTGEHSRRHNSTLRAIANAVAARSSESIVYGDKLQAGNTRVYNDGHVADFVSVGGAPHTSADAVHEVKAVSPLTATHHAGVGARYGGIPEDVGHYTGFGNTEEHLRWQNLGCKTKGIPEHGPLDHQTGKGWVQGFGAPDPSATSEKRRQGADYYDAIHVKNNRVYLWVVECFGGVSPAGLAELRCMGRLPSTTRDGTRYGSNPSSPCCYLTHHVQRISAAVVVSDATHILEQAGRAKVSAAHHRA